MNTAIATIGHNSVIAAYRPFIDQLDELRDANGATFDYDDPEGNADARSHIHNMRKVKGALKKVRVTEKAESLAHGRLVDGQAKELTAEIDALIEVHAAPLKAIEDREKERQQAHERDIEEMEQAGIHAADYWMTFNLDAFKDRLAELEAEVMTEERWAEFYVRAVKVRETAMAALREAIESREEYDTAQADLTRLRQEEDARKQSAREATIREEAKAEATEKAEWDATAERKRVEAEKKAADDSRLRGELELRLEVEKAEREKAEAETRAANAEKDAAERLEREATEKADHEAAETAKREANKRHATSIIEEVVAAFVAGGMKIDHAKSATRLIALHAIPNVSISY